MQELFAQVDGAFWMSSRWLIPNPAALQEVGEGQIHRELPHTLAASGMEDIFTLSQQRHKTHLD